MRHSRFFLPFVLVIVLLSGTPAIHAQDKPPQFTAKETGIYRVDTKGQRSLIVKPKSDEVFIDSTLSISPNQAWALIDHVPRNPGPGRVEEVRVLISLRNGTRMDPEVFKKKYGEWLGEGADWDPDAPSTIEMENGKRILLR
jgi:hypothetical protein